jgi:hypothetical protein
MKPKPNLFRRGGDPKKSIGIGQSIQDKLRSHPICKAANSPFEGVKPESLRSPDLKVWVNPKNRFCFNANLCSIQDIEDCMEGKGVMVRGRTLNDKRKYWEYAVAEEGSLSKDIFNIRYYWKWFDKIPENSKVIGSFSSDKSFRIHEPITIPSMNNGRDKRERDEKVIVQVFSPMVKEIENEAYSILGDEKIKEKYRDILKGVCKSMLLFGIGYWGGNSEPAEIANFSWSIELVLAKGRYKQLLARGVELPDFEWISKRN